MKILMLGWEFPPFISGGLGTACHGLTRALDALGHHITFVLPRTIDRTESSHVKLLSPESVNERDPSEIIRAIRRVRTSGSALPGASESEIVAQWLHAIEFSRTDFAHARFRALPAEMTSPYTTVERTDAESAQDSPGKEGIPAPTGDPRLPNQPGAVEESSGVASTAVRGFLGVHQPAAGADYAGDLIGETRRYAEMCVALAAGEQYDVIHAHDWLTYPAGMAMSRSTGIPLVVHVHSTEFDRSGEHTHQQVYDIERRGMHAAARVITVSHWTRSIVQYRYGVDPGKIRVVWNGIESPRHREGANDIAESDKIVLFLGRITMQKGPEYFIAAAKRVLEKVRNVKFVVAGSGDMATRMIELAAEMGIGHKVLFTGFLRGADVEMAYRLADCYVMPSVSEPFGIAPLEAISHDVPVIISKQSGVSEALTHALKVDFWDIDEIANKIIAVLRHPPLGQMLRHHGAMELRTLTWDGAAHKCVDVYHEAAQSLTRQTAVV